MRMAQMLELRHKERIVGKALKGPVDEGLHLYLGVDRARGLVMVSPSLEEFVAGKLDKEAAKQAQDAVRFEGPHTEAELSLFLQRERSA